MPVVPGQARQQPGAHERGLAGPGGAQDHQQILHTLIAQAAQAVQPPDDGGLPAKEHGGVFRLQRLEASVGCPLGVLARRPFKTGGVQAGLLQAAPQRGEADSRETHVSSRHQGLTRDRDTFPMVTRHQVTELPFHRHLAWNGVERHRGDDHAEDDLAQLLGKQKLRQAPPRGQPGWGNKEHHGLAAVGGLLEGVLPAFARIQPLAGLDVKEEVAPAIGLEPLGHGQGLGIVLAGMADEDHGHGYTSRTRHTHQCQQEPLLENRLTQESSPQARPCKGSSGPNRPECPGAR